jgi:hypothetical protein
MSVTQDAAGWTVVTASADSRIIYVSNSTGNDANNGLSAATAKKTIAAGESLLRAGMADHLLLKRGDTFTNQNFGNNQIPNGRSAQEPTYIGAFGTGARPQILTGSGKLYNDVGTFTNIVIQGLYARPHTRTDTTNDLAGIEVNANCTNLIIEDCYITEFQSGLILQGSGTNVQVRRNIVTDCYVASSAGYSTGFFTNGFTTLLLEENLFDHNGWKTGVEVNAPWFNHDIYLSGHSTNTTMRGNIVGRSTGVAFKTNQLDGTFVCTNNLFFGSGYTIGIGTSAESENPGDDPPAGIVVTFEDNVVTEGGGPDGYGDGGDIVFQNIESGTVRNNLLVNLTYSGNANKSFQVSDDNGANGTYGAHNLTIEGNVQYNYRAPLRIVKPTNGTITGIQVNNNYFQEPNLDQTDDPPYIVSQRGNPGVTYSGNTYYRGGTSAAWFENGQETFQTFAQWKSQVEPTAVQQKLVFFDPTRTTVSYAATQGLTSFDQLMTQMRAQSQSNWRTEFTADAVNDYIRAGFVVDPVGVPQLPNFSTGSPPAGSGSGSEAPPAPSQQAVPDAGSGSSSDFNIPVDATTIDSIHQDFGNIDVVMAEASQSSQLNAMRFERTNDSGLLLALRDRDSFSAAPGDELGDADIASDFGDSDESFADDNVASSYDWSSVGSAHDRVFAGLTRFN